MTAKRLPSLRGPGQRNALVLANMGLVYSCVKRLFSRETLAFLGEEDVYQEAFIALLRAAETWDETRGAFSTHAYWRIRGQLDHFREACTRRLCTPQGKHLFCSLSETLLHSTAAYDSALLVDREREAKANGEGVRDDRLEMLRKAIQRLPRALREVIDMRLKGKTLLEIAVKLGITRQGVKNREHRAHVFLREILGLPEVLSTSTTTTTTPR